MASAANDLTKRRFPRKPLQFDAKKDIVVPETPEYAQAHDEQHQEEQPQQGAATEEESPPEKERYATLNAELDHVMEELQEAFEDAERRFDEADDELTRAREAHDRAQEEFNDAEHAFDTIRDELAKARESSDLLLLAAQTYCGHRKKRVRVTE